MSINKSILLFATLLLPTGGIWAQRTVQGTVFEDVNHNGIFDKGEAGLADIPVSNGIDVVRTNAKGHYKIALPDGFSLFPILPANYTLEECKVVNSAFINSSVAQNKHNNFGLTPKQAHSEFRLNAIGDIQVSDQQELYYASQTLWPELMQGNKADLNLFLGDLVNNNLSLYGDLRTLMEQLPQQTWTLPGNHDRDIDSVRRMQTKTYNDFFGSDVYAFNEGKVHFITLNNVYGKGPRAYTGRFTKEQLEFVKNDLALVPHDRLIVLAMHIPLIATHNKDSLLSLLNGRGDVLVISGHLHDVMRAVYGTPSVRVHELGAGATCGFWWTGERGWDGMPDALQQGGAPRNYFIVNFSDNHYTLRFKGVGLDSTRQMALHVIGTDSLDSHVANLSEMPTGTLVATLWGACDSTLVECRIDGGDWMPCKKAHVMDLNVARYRQLNQQKAYPTLYSRLTPLRKRASRLVWTLLLPEAYRQGIHLVEVRAHDSYGYSATGFCSYSLQ